MYEFFDFIKDFILSGIYDILNSVLSKSIEWAILLFWKILLFKLELAWELVEFAAANIDLSGYIELAVAYLPPDAAGLYYALGVPEAINIIVSAYITTIAFKFIPFL